MLPAKTIKLSKRRPLFAIFIMKVHRVYIHSPGSPNSIIVFGHTCNEINDANISNRKHFPYINSKMFIYVKVRILYDAVTH